FEASRVFEGVEFNTAINPLHSFNDMYTIKYDPLGINEKYTEHTWAFPLEAGGTMRSEEHTSELQSRENLVCRLLLEKKKHVLHDLFVQMESTENNMNGVREALFGNDVMKYEQCNRNDQTYLAQNKYELSVSIVRAES